MTPRNLLRAAAVFLGIFALGHTGGGMLMPSSRGDEEDQLLSALGSYRFDIMGFRRSHLDFYTGEGWYLSLLVILMVVMCWQLGTLSVEQPAIARRLLPIPAAFALVSTALCAMYFFAAPLVTSALALVAIVMAGVKLRAA